MIITTNRVAVDRARLVEMPIQVGFTAAGLTATRRTTDPYTFGSRLLSGVAVSHC